MHSWPSRPHPAERLEKERIGARIREQAAGYERSAGVARRRAGSRCVAPDRGSRRLNLAVLPSEAQRSAARRGSVQPDSDSTSRAGCEAAQRPRRGVASPSIGSRSGERTAKTRRTGFVRSADSTRVVRLEAREGRRPRVRVARIVPANTGTSCVADWLRPKPSAPISSASAGPPAVQDVRRDASPSPGAHGCHARPSSACRSR